MSIDPEASPQPTVLDGLGEEDLTLVAVLAEHGPEVAQLAAELILTRVTVTTAHDQIWTGERPVTPGTARSLTAVAVQLENSLTAFRRILRELT